MTSANIAHSRSIHFPAHFVTAGSFQAEWYSIPSFIAENVISFVNYCCLHISYKEERERGWRARPGLMSGPEQTQNASPGDMSPVLHGQTAQPPRIKALGASVLRG